MERLINWATSRGADCKVCTQSDRPRTLFAAQDISPGDVVFSLPCDLLMQGYSVLDDEEYGPAFRSLLQEVGSQVLDQRSLLVLLLLLERCKGQQSAFAPYIDLLPQTYDDPFWWSDADLQVLQGTRLQQAVRHYHQGLQQSHGWVTRLEQLHLETQEQQQCQCGSSSSGASRKGGTLSTALNGWGLSLDAVKWARSAVWSRAFTVKGLRSTAAAAAAGSNVDGSSSSSVGAVVALIPVLDMCDHHPEQRVTWRVMEQQQRPAEQQQQTTQQRQQQVFQFTTLKPVSKGAELFNNYGTTKPNEELLLGYGFVLEDNPHDSFLVTISHTAASSSSSSDGAAAAAATIDESTCDDAAVWHQRLSAMAAAGLKLEVPISISNPLPGRLLDVLLLATAAPIWQLSLLLSVSEKMNSSLQQQQQQSLYAKAPFWQQLKVLTAIKQQLTAKLQGMLLIQQINNMLDPSNVTMTHHAKLAAVYVKSQQQILTAALEAVQTAAHTAMLGALSVKIGTVIPLDVAASMTANVTTNETIDNGLMKSRVEASREGHESLTAAAAASTGASALIDVPHIQLGRAFQWCDVCEAISTVGSSNGSNSSDGSSSSSILPAGSTVLQLPLASCLTAADEQQMTMQLMLAAAAAAVTDKDEQQQQQLSARKVSSPAAAYFARCWQQQQQQGEEAVSSHIPWWLHQHQQQLVNVLQDSPTGQQLQQVVEDKQQDFGQLMLTLQQCTTAATCSENDATNSSSSSSSSTSQEQHQQAERLLHAIQTDPSAAFRYFCWARQLVQQAAVTVMVPAHNNDDTDANTQQQQQQQRTLLLIPGLQNMPQNLGALVLDISIRAGSSSSTLSGQQQQQQHVQVKTACDVPAGLVLHSLHPVFLAQSNAQQLLIEQGPVAVAAAAGSSTDNAGDQHHQQQQQQQQQQEQCCHHMYEMLICPSEDDHLANLKLQLLADTGLGLCHYLLQPDQQQQQQQQQLKNVLTAMAIGLCDDPELLSPAVVQQVAAAHHKAVATAKASAFSVAAVSHTAAMLVDEDTSASTATAAGSSKGLGSWQQVQDQLLQRYGKQCRVQLKQVLKADKEAVQQALLELGQLRSAAEAVKGRNAQQHHDQPAVKRGWPCTCSSGNPGHSSSSQIIATSVDGLQFCLTGLLRVLSAWLLLVKDNSSGKKHGASKRLGGKDSSTKTKKKRMLVDV